MKRIWLILQLPIEVIYISNYNTIIGPRSTHSEVSDNSKFMVYYRQQLVTKNNKIVQVLKNYILHRLSYLHQYE